MTGHPIGQKASLRTKVSLALDTGNLGDDASGVDGTETGNGVEGMGDGQHGIGDRSVDALELALHGVDVIQAPGQGEVDRWEELRIEGIGILRNLLYLTGHVGWVSETALALGVKPGGQVLQGHVCDVVEGGELAQ